MMDWIALAEKGYASLVKNCPSSPLVDGSVTFTNKDIELVKLFKRVFNVFEYTKDIKQFGIRDDWREYTHILDSGECFQDDCDGFALTCASLLLKSGVPRDKVKLAGCLLPWGGGHLVCIVELDGTEWVLDNMSWIPNLKSTYTDHKWLVEMRCDRLGEWVVMLTEEAEI